MSMFLDPLSRACLQPRAWKKDIQQAEAALQLQLPWELFELFSWANGQEVRPDVQFADGARLLTLGEMLRQVQSEHGPATLRKAFKTWMHHRQRLWDSRSVTNNLGFQGSEHSVLEQNMRSQEGQMLLCKDQNLMRIDVDASSSSSGLMFLRYHRQSAQSIKLGVAGTDQQPFDAASGILLPFTDIMRGGKQFCVDLDGHVWLRSGFNQVYKAGSLAKFLQGILR